MGDKSKRSCPCGSGKRRNLCCGQAAPANRASLSPVDKLEMRRIAESHAKAGRHLEACDILEKLAAASPRNPLIWNDLGIEREASGQLDQALDALRRGHKADPTYPPILYNLGKFTLDRLASRQKSAELRESDAEEMLGEAIKFLNANLDRDPDNADAHQILAEAYAVGNDQARSRAHMAVALRLRKELESAADWRIDRT